MLIKTLVFTLMTFFHDLFTVIWMGGLIVTAISFIPAVKESLGSGPEIKKVMASFQKRHRIWVYISMAGLILTGIVMTHRSPDFVRLFSWGNPYSVALSIKHILVIIMIAITLVRTLALGKNQGNLSQEKESLNMKLLLVNVVLAVIVLLNSGLVAAFNNSIHN